MRPHVICHMMSSLDGRIDPASLHHVTPTSEYEATGDELGGDAWLCGRTTLQKDFADYLEPEPFPPGPPAGPQPPHVARTGATSFAIAADTRGQLLWNTSEIDGDPIVALVSGQASLAYLAALRERGVSYIVSGTSALDLSSALDQLHALFGVRTLLLEGGGHINGAFVSAGLLDEVSLVLVPAIDGRSGVPTVFDGRTAGPTPGSPGTDFHPLRLDLQSVTQRSGGVLWLRYTVHRHA